MELCEDGGKCFVFSAHCSSCAQWVKADAAERRVKIPSGAALLVPFVSVIGIPYFFFRTYPIKKGRNCHDLCFLLPVRYDIRQMGRAMDSVLGRTVTVEWLSVEVVS